MPARRITDNIQVRMSVIKLQLPFGRSGLFGVEIKDADFDVKRNSEFVLLEINDSRPHWIEIIEHTVQDGGGKGE